MLTRGTLTRGTWSPCAWDPMEKPHVLVEEDVKEDGYHSPDLDLPRTPDDAKVMAAAKDLLIVALNAQGAYEALKLAGLDAQLPGYERCVARLKETLSKVEGIVPWE